MTINSHYGYTRLYMAIHRIHDNTQPYITIQSYTLLYAAIHGYTVS